LGDELDACFSGVVDLVTASFVFVGTFFFGDDFLGDDLICTLLSLASTAFPAAGLSVFEPLEDSPAAAAELFFTGDLEDFAAFRLASARSPLDLPMSSSKAKSKQSKKREREQVFVSLGSRTMSDLI